MLDYHKHIMALTYDGPARGMERPFTAALPQGDRLVATNGHVAVALPMEQVGDGPAWTPPDVTNLWADLARRSAKGTAGWPGLVALAKESIRATKKENSELRARYKVSAAGPKAALVPLREAIADAVRHEKAVRASIKGQRSKQATEARRTARQLVVDARERLAEAKKLVPVRPEPIVPVISAGTTGNSPLLDARLVVAVDRALRAADVEGERLHWTADLNPVAVRCTDGEVAALIMPRRH